jgi:hypothetical protein
MIYTVICTDVSDYINWQCELLEHTWKRAEQPGELIRLITCPSGTTLPQHDHARVIHIAEPSDRTGGYLPFERLFALQDWLQSEQPDGSVLVIDPDCVFRRAIVDEVEPGAPLAQHWRDLRPRAPAQAATWPAMIHTRDLEKLMPRWIDATRAVRIATGRWESDMYGLVTASAAMGLRFSLEDAFAGFIKWPDEFVGDAPIVHYCQKVVAEDGTLIWFKHEYQPWEEVVGGEQARHAYCRDLLELVNEFATYQRRRPEDGRSKAATQSPNAPARTRGGRS